MMLVDVSLEPGDPCRFDYLQLEEGAPRRRRFYLSVTEYSMEFSFHRKSLGKFCKDSDSGTIVESEGNIVNVRFTFTFSLQSYF